MDEKGSRSPVVWDPFADLETFSRWPFRGRGRPSRLLEDVWEAGRSFAPAVDISENDSQYTVTAELAPGQWVDLALTNVVGMPGIWVLIYVSALMFVMRHFAGPIVDRISSVGLLTVSCIAAAVGLYTLSAAGSPVAAFVAANW